MQRRYRVRLDHVFTDEQCYLSILAETKKEAALVALQQKDSKWEVWECVPIAPGGARKGAGRPPGRKTKPMRVPVENLAKVKKLDAVIDILREWKLRSSLNQKSARFYFLDQAIAEIESQWGEL